MTCEMSLDRWWETMDHLGIAVFDLCLSDETITIEGDGGMRIRVERRIFDAGMRAIETDRERARIAIHSLPFSSQIRAVARFAARRG